MGRQVTQIGAVMTRTADGPSAIAESAHALVSPRAARSAGAARELRPLSDPSQRVTHTRALAHARAVAPARAALGYGPDTGS